MEGTDLSLPIVIPGSVQTGVAILHDTHRCHPERALATAGSRGVLGCEPDADSSVAKAPSE